MKQKTIENFFIVVLVGAIIFMAKGFVNKQMRIDEMKKAHVDSLEKVALRIDSLEKIVSFYEVQNPDWEFEVDASCKEFARDFENGLGKDSLRKVVIVGTTNGDGNIKWLIKTKLIQSD